MRSDRIPLAGPNEATAYIRDRKVDIRSDVDMRFRQALREAVTADGGKTARNYIAQALSRGPSRGGVVEAMRHFGDDINVKLQLTAEIVDGIEISVPGFKKWLELTGFANDIVMIKGFIAWAEFKNGAGRVISTVRPAFEHR